MHKLSHKFGIIGGLLVFFFFAGYVLLAYFLQLESKSMQHRSAAMEIRHQVESLSSDFIRIRFLGKTILSHSSSPKAQKEFGSLLAREYEGIEQLFVQPKYAEITAILHDIPILLHNYENSFNSLIQLRTEEQFVHTQLRSIYQAISSNLFRRNDIALLRPLFNLARFQEQYLATHRESALQALTVVLNSLQRKLVVNSSSNSQINAYCSNYMEKLARDFALKNKNKKLNNSIDDLSFQLAAFFAQGTELADRKVEQENERLQQLRSHLRLSLVISIAIGMFGVILILVLLASRIVNPVHSLIKVARSVRKGDMAARFQPNGSRQDEITQLGIDINTMLDTLGAREHELQEHRIHLAELVDERTRELRLSNESLQLEVENRIEAEQELIHSSRNLEAEKERLAVTLYSIGDGVITTDTHGRVALLNRIAEKLCGWSQQEAAGRQHNEVFVLKDIREIDSQVLHTNESNRPLRRKLILIARDGTEKRIDASNSVIRDQEKKAIGAVLVFRDIEEQEKMERELHKVKKLESVGILAGGIAHDFNNILTAILGNISLANQLIQPEHQAYPLLIDAEKASLQARELTQQLLTFSRGGDPVIETVDLAALLRDTAGFILRGSNVASTFAIADQLWPVVVDSGQINQVVQNLLINGIQAMPAGGRVIISANNMSTLRKEELPELKAGDYVQISIQDSGSGIAEDIIDNIFDPYFSTKATGSGLGLAICHSIITKHGGGIRVSSTRGQGSCFSFYLPAERDKIVEKVEIEDKTPVRSTSRRGRIMLMDDEPMVRAVAAKMLRIMGHEPMEVRDGAEALACYRKQAELGEPVDIVIMDLTIPGGMGGRETIGLLLAEFPDAVAIVSSGYSNDPVMADFRTYGFKGVISKPFKITQLETLIGGLLE